MAAQSRQGQGRERLDGMSAPQHATASASQSRLEEVRCRVHCAQPDLPLRHSDEVRRRDRHVRVSHRARAVEGEQRVVDEVAPREQDDGMPVLEPEPVLPRQHSDDV